MNADEIVKALHKYAKNAQENFEVDTMRDFDSAAELIESTQSQLADYHHMSELVDGKMEENQRLRRINENLQAQLAESQRRERAAVEDLEGAGACFTCKHFRRNGGDCFGAGRCRLDGIEIWPCNEPGVYRVEVPDDGRKTYEWRGPQEAGEGETE